MKLIFLAKMFFVFNIFLLSGCSSDEIPNKNQIEKAIISDIDEMYNLEGSQKNYRIELIEIGKCMEMPREDLKERWTIYEKPVFICDFKYRGYQDEKNYDASLAIVNINGGWDALRISIDRRTLEKEEVNLKMNKQEHYGLPDLEVVKGK